MAVWAVVVMVARFGLEHRRGLQLVSLLLVGAGLVMVCGGAVLLLDPVDPAAVSWWVGVVQQHTSAGDLVVAGASAQIMGALVQLGDSYDRRRRSEHLAARWGYPIPPQTVHGRLTGDGALRWSAGLAIGTAGAVVGALVGAVPLELANPLLRTALQAPQLDVWATSHSNGYRAIQAVMALIGATYGVRTARFFWARRTPPAAGSQEAC